MDIRAPKLVWCGIMCHIIIFIYLFNTIVESWITFLSQHDKFTCGEKKKTIFLTPFKHDVHVCVFIMMYIYVCK
jgi:hypothetical protein